MADTAIVESRSAALIAQEAEAEGRTAFIVMGGNLYTPTAYRSQLERAWHMSINGMSADNSVLSEAYAVSAEAYAAIEYRCNTLAALPLMVTEPSGQPAEWHPLTYFMQSAYTLYWHIEAALNIWGVSYLLKRKNAYGYPTALEWLHPEDVSPITDQDDNVTEYQWRFETLEPKQVVRILSFDPGRSLNGKGGLEVALSRVTTEQSLITHSGSYFFNAARPDGMLVSKTKLNDVEQKKAQQDWQSFKGSKNGWRTFVSGGEWEWIPVTANPKDLVIPELKEDLRRDVCIIFRTHPALIGAAGASDPLSANSTLETLTRNHIQTNTLPQIRFINEQLNFQWLHVDFEDKNFYSLAVDEKRVPELSQVTSDRAATVTSLTSPTVPLLNYDEARENLGLEPDPDYLRRDPTQALALFNGTGVLLDEARMLVGLKPLPGGYGQVLKLTDGRLVKLDDLPRLADKTLQEPFAPSPFSLNINQPPAQPAPAPAAEPPALPPPPAPAPALKIVSSGQRAAPGCTVILSLTGLVPLQAALTLVKYQLGFKASPVTWTEPDELHVTLIHASNMTPAQERGLYGVIDDLEPLALNVGKLEAFRNDQTVLYLAVEKTPDLLALQQALFDQAQALKIELSQHSDPKEYKPHVTLGYAPSDFEVPEFDAHLTGLQPSSIQFSREAYEITYQKDVSRPLAPVNRTSRAGVTIELAAPLAGHHFVLTAQRMLTRHLAATAEDGADVAVEWYDSESWRLPLVTLGGLNYADAARIMSAIQLDQVKVDVQADGFIHQNGEVGLSLEGGEDLTRLRESLALALEAAGYEPGSARRWQAWIPLGQVTEDFEGAVSSAACGEFPLTLREVGLYVNKEARASWALKSASPAQLSELVNYERKVARRGAGVAFELDTLSGTLAGAYLRSALAEGIEPAHAFQRARTLLNDNLEYVDVDVEPTPEQIAAYWQRYDDLQVDLGADFAKALADALPGILEIARLDPTPAMNVLGILDAQHTDLINAWVGTEDEPGPLAALMLAGMAAGNEALIREVSIDPNKRAEDDSAISLTIDWQILNQQAIDFARQYAFELIRGLDATTQKLISEAVVAWLESGESLDGLEERIRVILEDSKRARKVAQTEAIRVYNRGAFDRWKSVGVHRATWQTVRDQRVCPICRPLHGQVADIDAGWVHPGGSVIDDGKAIDAGRYQGQVYRESAHTGCRCFRRPYFERTTRFRVELAPRRTITQAEAARILKTSRSNISRWVKAGHFEMATVPDRKRPLIYADTLRLPGDQ